MECSGFKPSPAPLNDLKKKVLPLHDHTVCMYYDLIVVIACDCVVCVLVMIPWVPGKVASG